MPTGITGLLMLVPAVSAGALLSLKRNWRSKRIVLFVWDFIHRPAMALPFRRFPALMGGRQALNGRCYSPTALLHPDHGPEHRSFDEENIDKLVLSLLGPSHIRSPKWLKVAADSGGSENHGRSSAHPVCR